VSVSDTDWQLLSKKLDAFEAKLKKLENDVFILNRYVDTQLSYKYYPNQNVDPSYYALSQGNFVDAGLPQAWKLSTTTEDFEE
jgi:hypothetical protein